jgi:hypothetical protein
MLSHCLMASIAATRMQGGLSYFLKGGGGGEGKMAAAGFMGSIHVDSKQCGIRKNTTTNRWML